MIADLHSVRRKNAVEPGAMVEVWFVIERDHCVVLVVGGDGCVFLWMVVALVLYKKTT